MNELAALATECVIVDVAGLRETISRMRRTMVHLEFAVHNFQEVDVVAGFEAIERKSVLRYTAERQENCEGK